MPKCRVVEEAGPEVVNIVDMKPLQVGYIVGGPSGGHLVWRTADSDRSEVVDLSSYEEDSCWVGGSSEKVRLLAPGEEVTLVLSND